MKLGVKMDPQFFGELHPATRVLIVKLVIGLAALGLCCAVFILPQWRSMTRVDKEIAAGQERKLQLTTFLPVYGKLTMRLEDAGRFDAPLPSGAPLEMAELDGLPDRLRRMGAEAGLEPLDVTISPNSLREGAGRIKLQCVLSGTVDQFDAFWRKLNGLSCLDNVDRVEVQAVTGGLEFYVELWVLLKRA